MCVDTPTGNLTGNPELQTTDASIFRTHIMGGPNGVPIERVPQVDGYQGE